MDAFSVTVLPAANGRSTVLRLSGEADLTTTALHDTLTAEIAHAPRLLLVDMTELTFIDSGAMQMITGAYRVLRQNGGTLAVVNPGRSVGRILQLSGLSQVITIYDSVNEAITAAG